jgi:heme exporter protein A
MAASTCIEAVNGLASLELEHLTLARGERVLFRELGIQLAAGQALSLEGPNGAGKTSLLRAIAGFLAPSSGTIRLRTKAGAEVGSGEERAGFAGWLGHQDGAKPQMTARETLGFFAAYYGRSGDTAQVLTTVGLTRIQDMPLQYYSAGQKKRLALARLLLGGRPLWLLDEPLAALDAAGKRLAADFIARHCREGGIAIAATHEPLGLDCLTLTLGGGRIGL